MSLLGFRIWVCFRGVVVGRGEITDKAWERIEPLLPGNGGGRRWRDHRQVLNGIAWKIRTGAPWQDVPERYGPWKTCHERLRTWTLDGTWDKVLAEIIVKNDSVGDVDGEHIGRSRGGLTSKLHLGAEARGRPLAMQVTEGHAGDNPQLLPLLDNISVRRVGRGRSRKRPDNLLTDKAYSHPSTRAAVRKRGIVFVCPEKTDQIARRKAKGSAGGRPPAFDADAYRDRNVVERCFNRLKQFRDIATPYAKRSAYRTAEITITAIILWLR